MKILLHACCGPCSLEPTRIFGDEGIDFSVDYTNPNIFPKEEYEHRRETLKEYVTDPHEIGLYEGDYDPEAWEEQVAIFGTDREKRCRACYRMRLERVAERAAELGYDAISTTLTISPYQLTDVIFEELEQAAQKHGLQAVCRDFRECYPEATRISRELGMYRQDYCGCRFSIAEAKADRERLKAQRKAEKAKKRRALIWAAAEGIENQANQF